MPCVALVWLAKLLMARHNLELAKKSEEGQIIENFLKS